MLRIIYFSLPLFFLTHISTAQHSYFGLAVGYVQSNVKAEKSSFHLENSDGYAFGFSYDRYSENHFYWGTDLLLTRQGYKRKLMAGPNNLDLTEEFYYLSLPVKFGFKTKEKFFGFGSIGLSPSILLRANFISQEPGSPNSRIKDDISEFRNKLDISGIATLGMGYFIGEKSLLSLQVNRHIGLLSLTDDDHVYGQVYSRLWILLLEFKYRIKSS